MKGLNGRGEVSPLYHLTLGRCDGGLTDYSDGEWRYFTCVPYDSVKTWVQWSRQQNSSRGSRKHCESAHLVSVTGDVRMLTRLAAEIWGAQPSVSDLQLEYSFHTFPSYNDYILRIGYKLSLSFPLFIRIRYQSLHYFLFIILFLFYVQVFLLDRLIFFYLSSFGTHSFPFPK